MDFLEFSIVSIYCCVYSLHLVFTRAAQVPLLPPPIYCVIVLLGKINDDDDDDDDNVTTLHRETLSAFEY